MDGVKEKQFSCYAHELPQDEQPDFLNDPNRMPSGIKASIKDAIFAGLEDESL